MEKDKYERIGEKEVIKNEGGKQVNQTVQGKIRPNEGEPSEKERLREEKKTEGGMKQNPKRRGGGCVKEKRKTEEGIR